MNFLKYWLFELNIYSGVGGFSSGHRGLRREKAESVKFVELPAEKLLAYNQAINIVSDLKLIVDNRFSIEVGDGFNPGTRLM